MYLYPDAFMQANFDAKNGSAFVKFLLKSMGPSGLRCQCQFAFPDGDFQHFVGR